MRTTTIRAAITAALTIAASAVFPSFAATTITESVTLTEDTDWTEFGTVTLAPGVTVDLNGHKLYTSGIVGSAGSIGTTDYVTNGSFENGYSFTANSGKWAYTGNITFNNFGWTGNSGISKETGTWKQVAAPGGSAVWFFQKNAQVSTTVSVPESGFYTVTFYYVVSAHQRSVSGAGADFRRAPAASRRPESAGLAA